MYEKWKCLYRVWHKNDVEKQYHYSISNPQDLLSKTGLNWLYCFATRSKMTSSIWRLLRSECPHFSCTIFCLQLMCNMFIILLTRSNNQFWDLESEFLQIFWPVRTSLFTGYFQWVWHITFSIKAKGDNWMSLEFFFFLLIKFIAVNHN